MLLAPLSSATVAASSVAVGTLLATVAAAETIAPL